METFFDHYLSLSLALLTASVFCLAVPLLWLVGSFSLEWLLSIVRVDLRGYGYLAGLHAPFFVVPAFVVGLIVGYTWFEK